MIYTDTHRRLLEALGDCELHTLSELRSLLDVSLPTLRVHISNLRKSLRPMGHDISCRDGSYSLVRLLANPYR